MLKDGRTISYPLERKYINTWRNEPFPVIFALYDVGKRTAYWLHMQPLIEQMDEAKLPSDQQYLTLHFDREKDAVSPEAIRTWKRLNDDTLNEFKRLREATKQGMNKPP